ncbi:MAG: redoxin domain-containing protein [bacterium]
MQLGKLAKAHETIKAHGAQLVAIAADTPAQTARFKRRFKLPFTLLVDPELTVIRPWGLRQAGLKISVPATFVLRRDGRVVWRHISTNVWDRATVPKILKALRQLSTPARPSAAREML